MKKAFVLCVALGLVLTAVASAQQSTILQKVIVRVNGEIFTQTELEFRQIQTLRDQKVAVNKAADLSTDPGLSKALAEITPGLLLEAVDELMLVQHGREIGVKFSDAVLTKAIDQIKSDNGIKDDATFQNALKGEGMTMSDLRAGIERTYIIQQVTQHELMRNMTLTEEELRRYYSTHQSEFMRPATVTLRELFVAVPTETVGGTATINVAADEAAREKIQGIRARALKGEDFVKLVGELSDSGTKANGGLIGPVNVADLSTTLAQVIDKLKPGEISEPIKLRAGYQIIKLETKSASEPEAMDKVKDQITQRILESRVEVEKAKFLVKLYSQAVIEWKDEAYRKLYDSARAARLAATKQGK